jgi:outer membrane receptor protein involved in Fe transport
VLPPGAGPDFPTSFKADTIISYEAGLRTETADRKFAFDGALFYLDWRNILIFAAFNTGIGPVGANDNGGRARSEGAEATITLRPTRGFRVMFNGAYTDAKLLDDTPPVTGGLAGDHLPFVPKFSGSVSADYDWRIAGETRAFVGADARIVSRQPSNFDPTYRATFGHPMELPAYQVVDLRAGLEFRHFTVEAFVRNVGNSRGLTAGGGFGNRPGTDVSVSPIMPRTIGATFFANF